MNLKKQAFHIYSYAFASCLAVTDAVWVVLLTARGFTLAQVGLAEGIFHCVSLAAELPSGTAADLLGRRRTLALSGLMACAGALVMALGHGFASVCLSMALQALSYNLISGTLEALSYDSLVQAGRSETFLQLDANCSQLQSAAQLISNACSLLSAWFSYLGLYLIEAVVALLRTAAALGLEEPVVTATQAARREHPLRNLRTDLRRHLRQTSEFLRGSRRARQCIAADAVISLPAYLSGMYLQQRLVENGFPTRWLGLPLLLGVTGGMFGVAVGRRLTIRRLRPWYLFTALLCAGGTVAAGCAPIPLAVAGSMLISASTQMWFLHAQKALHDAFPSDQRATLVSVDSMAYSVLMIVASPVTGWAGDLTGHSGAGLLLLGAVVLCSGLAVLLPKRIIK